MWIWSSMPPTTMGMPSMPLMTPPIYWKMRGRSSFRIGIPVLFTWNTRWMSIFTNELAMFFFFRPYGAVFIFLFCVPGVDTPGCSLRPFRAALAIATDAVRSHRVAALKGRYDHRRRCKPPQSAADAALFFAKVLKIPTRFPRRGGKCGVIGRCFRQCNG